MTEKKQKEYDKGILFFWFPNTLYITLPLPLNFFFFQKVNITFKVLNLNHTL